MTPIRCHALAVVPSFGAANQDADVRRVVRENLKKTRLLDWPEKVETLKTALATG